MEPKRCASQRNRKFADGGITSGRKSSNWSSRAGRPGEEPEACVSTGARVPRAGASAARRTRPVKKEKKGGRPKGTDSRGGAPDARRKPALPHALQIDTLVSPQQARASVPWVAPQLEAHVQPGQLVRTLGGGPPPHAMAQHDRPVPPRTARPTRRGPHPSQAVRLSWPCGTAGGRARRRLRAERVARVVLAETARVRPWAVPHCPAAPGRRVPHRSQAVRSSLALRYGGGAGGTLSTQRTARTATDNRRR